MAPVHGPNRAGSWSGDRRPGARSGPGRVHLGHGDTKGATLPQWGTYEEHMKNI